MPNFLEPGAIGSSYGRLMWERAISYAMRAGFSELSIESDRYAQPYYLAMGETKIGASASRGANARIDEGALT